jgi:hypothetical protein
MEWRSLEGIAPVDQFGGPLPLSELQNHTQFCVDLAGRSRLGRLKHVADDLKRQLRVQVSKDQVAGQHSHTKDLVLF